MSRGTTFGVAIFAILLFLAGSASWIASVPPAEVSLADSLAGPSWSHPLGADRLGRDLWSRLVHGARLSLLVGLATVGISGSIGLCLGVVAGFRGGWIDELLMRIVDVLLAFPGILLAIALAATLGPGTANVILALSVVGWTGFARLARSETLSIRERPHVEAARSLGATSSRIVVLHVLPLLAGPMTVQATFGLAGAIVAESSLSFLGLGVAPPTPSWGSMLSEGRAFLLVAPHVAIVPGVAVFVSVLGLNLLGDGLRDRLAGVPVRRRSSLDSGGRRA